MLFRKKIKTPPLDIKTQIRHIAFIMDGNGRWAKKRALPRSLGHREGCKRIKEVALLCQDSGMEVMSLFCFSTENWNRPKGEIDYLFKLLEQFFETEIEELHDRGIKLTTLGDLTRLPLKTQEAIRIAKERTKENNKFILNICLNYGGHAEIVDAAKKIAQDVVDGKMKIDDINQTTFQNHLESNQLPPVDCMVRTSGEQRISNFMLWEIAYAELIFVKEHWPDFKKDSFVNVLEIYATRDRRFGGIKDGNK